MPSGMGLVIISVQLEQVFVISVYSAHELSGPSGRVLFHIQITRDSTVSQTTPSETVVPTKNQDISSKGNTCIRVIFSLAPNVAIVQWGISTSSILFRSTSAH